MTIRRELTLTLIGIGNLDCKALANCSRGVSHMPNDYLPFPDLPVGFVRSLTVVFGCELAYDGLT